MLFNSHSFVLLFLPAALACAYIASKRNHNESLIWTIVGLSVLFYGIKGLSFLPVLMTACAINYRLANRIIHTKSTALLAIGVSLNLGLLAYYKYANMIISIAEIFAGAARGQVYDIALPLALSFVTFEQISYLVDCRRGEQPRRTIQGYLLYIFFFPKLIAGPIIRFGEISWQIARLCRPSLYNITWGLSLFAIGLAKKIIIADNCAPIASLAFDASLKEGFEPSFAQAWLSALAYSAQIYFDFSGYSDMAVGLALMFGVFLPANFDSPYKARSISEFWRRWHMTLSRFLRDYLYIPLGGNKTAFLQVRNLVVVMVLGGLWHGAAYQFIIWGMLHGCMLAVNHLWRRTTCIFSGSRSIPGAHALSVTLTFLSVTLAWVLFRAASVDSALSIYGAMVTPNWSLTEVSAREVGVVAGALAIAFFAPNSLDLSAYRLFLRADGTPDQAKIVSTELRPWRPTAAWGFIIGGGMTICLLLLSRPSPFLYFNF